MPKIDGDPWVFPGAAGFSPIDLAASKATPLHRVGLSRRSRRSRSLTAFPPWRTADYPQAPVVYRRALVSF
jgi:hypothetical protein